MSAVSLNSVFGVANRYAVPSMVAALALALLFAIYRDLDFDFFIRSLLGADQRWLVFLVGAILLEQLVRAWKWRQILREVKPVAVSRLFGAILASFGIQLIVPMPVTPLVRSWLVARLEGLTVATLLSTVAVDRYVDAIVFALFIAFVGMSGMVPYVEGPMQVILSMVAIGQGLMFAGFAFGLYRARTILRRDDAHASRVVDWLARKGGRRFDGLRYDMLKGMVWPRPLWRQVGVVAASVLMKFLAASQFYWAGLALGVTIAPVDYIFLMVFSGLALIAAMFLRVPGVYFFALVQAFGMIDIPVEKAFAMLILIRVASMACMIGPGFVFGWSKFIDIRQMARRELANGAEPVAT